MPRALIGRRFFKRISQIPVLKKPVIRDLSAAEKAALSRKINQCADEQVKADHHSG
jgi:hypothetical protein